jgi:predicted MFS family arabinose efflux permease
MLQPRLGWSAPAVGIPLLAGAACLTAFGIRERMARDPMLPLQLFARRDFTVGNVHTLALYGGLSILFFLLGLFLQEVGGWSPTQAGLATLPGTLVMLALSGQFGKLADRLGPRLFLGAGPLVCAAGLLLFLRVGPDVEVLGALLPALGVFALGLAMTVGPQTAAVLAGVKEAQAGIASAVNNAVARVAGLIPNPARVVLARHCVGGQLVGTPREVARAAAGPARALTRVGTDATASAGREAVARGN